MSFIPSPLSALSFRAKLWFGLGGLFFILLLVSGISAGVLTHFSRELQRLLRENYDSTVFCNEMTGALDRLDAGARQLAWDEAGDAVDIPVQQKQFDDNLARQLNNVTLPGELEKSQYLARQWKAYRLVYDDFSRAAPDDRRRLYTSSLLPLFRETRAAAQNIAALNMDNVVSADGRVRQTMIQVRDVLLALAAIGALLAIVVVGAAGTTVLHSLRDLTASASQIGAGELDLSVSVRSGDEVGQLAAAFNAMAQRLREYRKIDHQRLQRAQNTMQLAIDSLPDAVLVLSADGQIEISNRTAHTHFGAEPGKRLADLGLPWLAALQQSVARGGGPAEPRGYASAVQLFDQGHERFLLPRGVPMFDADGALVGVTVVLADVTALRKADEFKSGLVSTVSHELRTPLTALRMSTMLLADETMGPLTPRQRKLVDAAKEESERLYQIIESLLEFSRAQAAATKPPGRVFPVKQMVAGALGPLSAGFTEKGIAVKVDVEGTADLLADESCAVSVLSNLLSNAMKFTPPHGQVSVKAESCGAQVAVTVSDSGPGVPPQFAERIFERFFRVPGRESIPGSGLGLAIARQLVEAHGGSLSYAARAGGGSVFRFTLPAAHA
jgi:signal transduction histidine kinase